MQREISPNVGKSIRLEGFGPHEVNSHWISGQQST
jgi:hypothetical protein